VDDLDDPPFAYDPPLVPAALLVYAPLRVERLAVRRALPDARVVSCGMGAARARRAAAAAPPAVAVAVAGLCGAVAPGLRPGDVIVASEVRGPEGTVSCSTAGLAEALAALGVGAVHVGPVASTRRVVYGPRRRALAAQGVLAADMESVWLAVAAGGAPFAVLRVVLDTPAREIYRPLASLGGAVRAWRALRRAAPALASWAASVART
jgi:4-hydroxy-3-methylbut-2-enyl diphosphate reductase